MKNGEKPNLDELLEQITDENRHEELDFAIVGEELPKKKFILEFDEVPKFVFVSLDGFRNAEIYRNGEKEYGWFKLNLEAEIDEPTVYEISYFACADKS